MASTNAGVGPRADADSTLTAAPSRRSRRPERLFEAYVFDLDGTIYLGDGALPGAVRLITELRRRDLPVRFLSNNPTKDPDQYAAKLTAMGLPTPVSDIVNTIGTTIWWLQRHHPGAVIFAIAEAPLQRALTAAGFRLSEDPAEIDVVIASYDRTFDYRKLQIAFDTLWFHQRGILIQTNPDRYCPFPGGRGQPDAAAITAAIEACTQRPCVASLGKPSPLMLDAALAGLPVRRENCLMVGDRLATDIRLGLDTGVPTACVLTGDTKAGELTGLALADQPTYVLDRVDQVLPAAVWSQCGWTAELVS
jgi:HAD superfamily hydrolase (TIGR01450 family)